MYISHDIEMFESFISETCLLNASSLERERVGDIRGAFKQRNK